MHVTVDRVKVVFLAVNSLPAQEHLALRVKIVEFSVDLPGTGLAVTVGVEVVSITVDLLEFALAVRAVLVAVFYAAGSLDKLCSVTISCRKGSRGVSSRHCRRGALHLSGDMIIQRVVELVSDLVYNVSFTVFDIGSDGAHVSLACDTDVACFHGEGEHAVVSGAVDIACILEVIDRCLHPAAAEGGRTVPEPVVVGKRGIHFFEKSGSIAGVSAVMVEFEYVSAQIDPAVHELVLNFTLNIAAGEI